MTTGQLIDLLIKDLKPEWSFNRIILLAIGMGTLISASAFLVAVGFRADIAGAIHSWRFLLKFVLTGTLAVSTTGMLSNLGRPNGAPERWGWGAAVASAMLVCAIAVELMPQPEAKWLVRLVGHNTRICLTVIPLLSVGPLLCFFAALHTGAPRAPGFAGAIAGVRGERNWRDILRGQLHRRQSAIRRDLVPARDPCGLDHRLFRGKALAALVADNQKIPPAVTAARGERPRPVADKNGLSWSTSVKKVALSVSLKAKPGKEEEEEVAAFLAGAQSLVAQEAGTSTWYAFRVDQRTFGIFDSFGSDAARQAHLEGAVAAALLGRAHELLDRSPEIHSVDILAEKLPA